VTSTGTSYFLHGTHFSVVPSGDQAGLQLFMLKKQNKNEK